MLPIRRIFRTLKPVISRTMFLQYLITALGLGLTVINIMYFAENSVEIALFSIINLGILLKFLPCCFLGDRLAEINRGTITALYSSNWIDQSEEFKKTLITFMELNKKERYFYAGSLFRLNMSTFLAVSGGFKDFFYWIQNFVFLIFSDCKVRLFIGYVS